MNLQQLVSYLKDFEKSNVFRSIKVTTLMTVYTLLWSVLLIVPGIIKFISYSMAYYILLDHPEYTASEAIKKSQVLMKGHKLDLFLLSLSFIGWFYFRCYHRIFHIWYPVSLDLSILHYNSIAFLFENSE